MNKHILMVIDHQLNPNKYTQEQLKHNRKTANAAYFAATAADYAYDTADAADAADAADYAAYWLDEYFKRSNESKQDYIDEINKGNKQ